MGGCLVSLSAHTTMLDQNKASIARAFGSDFMPSSSVGRSVSFAPSSTPVLRLSSQDTSVGRDEGGGGGLGRRCKCSLPFFLSSTQRHLLRS